MDKRWRNHEGKCLHQPSFFAGQIESLSSNKLGKESVIVEKIGYDKDGHTVYTKLGNGTETTYAYDKQRERLQSMMLKAGNDSIMENKYSYDAVDNILSIVNSGKGKSNLGGASTHNYTYDMLNRLTSANGSAKDIKYAMSMTFGKMSEPLTKVQTVDSTSVAQSYDLAYKYEDALHPTAPSQIGHEHYTYDANGNPILVENDSTDATREMFWDEDNRLMVLSDNGKTSRYTYNAGGERIIKSHGSMEGVYINGAPQGITFHETDEFTLYPASIITVNRHRFTKHYFIGDKRVASRIGQGEFRNVYGSNGSNVTAGQQDYAERMNQIENQREAYYRKAGVAPGLPTMKGSYADPEVTGKGYNILIDSLGDHRVPENWVQHPVINTEAGSNPGAPLAWGSPENPDDAVAGYGYVPCDTSEVEETFYYHSDHLGSTSYITDQNANVTQYDAYLPYGELLVDEHSSSADLPYKFNGKELDEETGLYYYGARYMNPVTSMWYGVDPLAEKYPNVSAFVYCMGNPIKLVDLDGLFPRKILKKGSSDTEYKLTTVAVKLLSLVSGVNENYIQNITVKEWDLLPENWSMTLGNTPDNVTIKSSSSYFTDDDNSDNINMIYNYAHEVGHIKQIARDGDSYVSNCTKHYILTMSHDNSPYEIEADMGYATLCAFANYARRFSKTGKDVISGIINSNKSDEIKLRLINKYWKSYMKYLKNQDNNLGKYSTKTLQNATQKAQEEKRDATMVEKRK